MRTKNRRRHERRDEQAGEDLKSPNATWHSAASGPKTRSESLQYRALRQPVHTKRVLPGVIRTVGVTHRWREVSVWDPFE
jgi:hypothetical protein